MDGGGGGSTVTQEAKCDKAIGGAPSPPSPFPGDNDGPTTTATTASPQSSAPSSVSGNANTDLGPVVIFVDVDGVLNTNWHGATAPMATEANHIEPRLVDNIAELTTRIASELQLASHIVVSSTWRLQPSQNSVLMAALHERGLDDLLHPTTPYTPNLGHRSSSSGRASEIGEWLYRQDPEPQLFLVLDDLNILFDDASGKPITGRIRDCNFVHTISETQAASAGAAASFACTSARGVWVAGNWLHFQCRWHRHPISDLPVFCEPLRVSLRKGVVLTVHAPPVHLEAPLPVVWVGVGSQLAALPAALAVPLTPLNAVFVVSAGGVWVAGNSLHFQCGWHCHSLL